MTMMRRLLLALLIPILLIACGDAPEPRQARELKVGIEDFPKTLDPRYATDAYGMRISHNLLFSALIEEGYDLQPAPGLAERWETPDDVSYIFHLRRDARFSDGRPLTADDVQFTFEHLIDPAINSAFGATLRSAISSIQASDPYTVKFTLTHPVPGFLYSIVVPILPAHIMRQQGDSTDLPVGSGPFRLISQSSTEIVLAPNEHYYGAPPRLDRLVFKIVSDDNTRFLKMKKGELDLLINAIPLDKIDEVRKPPLNETYNIIEEPGLSYNYISFNLDNPAVQDVRLRQAIAHAVNIEEIIAYRLDGHAVRATGLLAPLNPYYEGKVAAYPYDPDRAKALLDEAGLKDPDGDRPQPRLTLELKTSNNAQATGTARILQAQLAKVDINLDIRSYEWGTFYGDIRSGNFQMTTMRWVGIIDPDFYYDIFHSSQTPPKGNNRGRYASPDVDAMLDAGRITVTFPERKAVYAKVQQTLAEDLPYISLWHANNISIVHKRVKGYRQHPTGGFLSFRDISLE
jgi:peptide/nickel transport system substrate-binding protein